MVRVDDDTFSWVSAATDAVTAPPTPAFSPWDTGAGSMIGAGSSSGYGSGDLNGDGLDDSTGYAVGVMPDSNSPSGFSYNGTPTYSNGGLYTPSTTPATFGPAGPSESFFSPWDTGAGTMIGAGNAIDPGAAAMAQGDIGAYYEGLDEYLKNGINSPNLSSDWLEANQELIDPSYNPTSAGYSNWGLWDQNPPPIFSPQDARFALNYGGGQDQYLAPFTTPLDYGEPYNSLPAQGSFSIDPNAILDPSQTNYLSDSGETKPFYWPKWVPHLFGDTTPADTGPTYDYNAAKYALNYGPGNEVAKAPWSPNWDIFNQPDQAIHDPYAQYRDALGNVNGVVDPSNPAVNPETAREDIYGSASSGGNPFSVVATGALNQWNVPGANIIGPAIGTLADAATFGAGSGMASGNMDTSSPAFWGEAGIAAANAGSLGLGGGLVRNAAANIAGNLAGEYIPRGLEAYSETNLPGADIAGNPYVQGAAGIAGALGAGALGYFGPDIARGGIRAADRGLVGLDARINEPAYLPEQPMVFSTGRKPGPERTVIPESWDYDPPEIRARIEPLQKQQTELYASGMQYGRMTPDANKQWKVLQDEIEAIRATDAGNLQPKPLANDRLWFHSTRDMSYDLPDPDLAVGTQTGITQGPGIYMAADPAKSAGNYGPRTFVTEFDGNVLDLTKPVVGISDPLFPGSPKTWADVGQNIADKLNRAGYRTADGTPLDGRDLLAIPDRSRDIFTHAELKTAENGYGLRDDIATNTYDLIRGWSNDPKFYASLEGRFASGGTSGSVASSVQRIVNDSFADEGVDALFHHSPRADGDVLIVLNGEKARVVADVKNAPDAVKAGATLRDIKRGVASKVLEGSDKELRVTDYGDRFRLADRNGNVLGSAYLDTPSDTWKASRYVGLGKNEVTDVASRADAEKWIREGAASERSTPTTSIRTFGQRVSDETGALDMGAIGARFGEAGKRAANIFADAAAKEGRPTTGGIFDMLAPTERAGTGLVRHYEGAVGTAGLDLRRDMDLGNRLLREAKVPGAKWDGTRLTVARSPEMEQLFKALHGEGAPPPKLQKVYDAVKAMTAKEEAATTAADKAFVPRDDYFYRGWREVPAGKTQRAGTGKGQFGATPGFMKPRSDQSFSDILKTVYTKPDGTQVRLEPISWNPFEMAAVRKTAGEQFRAQNDLIAGLKETKLAVPADLAPEGWRVPRVGPAFEGKPFAFEPGSGKTLGPMERLAAEGTSPAIGYTQRWAVPDAVANDIESIFGKTPSFGSLDKVLSLGQKAKQSKLLLSLFQQMDFGARTLGALNAGVIDELATTVEKAITLHPNQSASALYRAGRKFLAIPKHIAELPLANVSGAAQRGLRENILSGKPLFKERPGITWKGISEAGGKFGTDISLVTRDITKDLGKPPSGLSLGVVGRRVRQVNAASQRGLFDGFYVKAQQLATENTILPRLMRQHPDWTDAQIMAGAADEMNKMFSTLGEYQTAIKNPAVKKLTRALIFSTNESEALLRGAASTVVGPNKRLWSEFYLGTFLGLAAIAETVHYATTGEHLPLERLNPIDTENKYGPLPFGYRTNFLAPDIPIKGRNNTNLTIDTVMQLDTVFRLLDPKSFIESRENVLPRTIANQITGEDFFGRPMKSPQDRLSQAAIDLLEPIGLGNLRGGVAGIGPDSEARVGKAGAIIQTLGGNVRAENNAALKDRAALEWAKATGATKNDGSPITEYADLDPLQRKAAIEFNPDIKRELEKRGEEAVQQGSEYGVAAAKREADRARIREDNIATQTQTDALYIDPATQMPKSYDDGKKWREDYNTLQYAIVKQNRAQNIIDPYTGKGYGSDMDQALDRYFAVIEQNQKGVHVDWDAVDAWKAANPEDAALVDKYTAGKENTDLTPIVTAKKAAQKAIETSGFWNLDSYDWNQVKKAAPDAGPFASYDEYRAAVIDNWKGQYIAQGYTAEAAENKASSAFSNTAIAKAEKAANTADNAAQTTWMLAHPEEALQAWRWGYWQPQKTVIGVNGLPKNVSELQWLTDYASKSGR